MVCKVKTKKKKCKWLLCEKRDILTVINCIRLCPIKRQKLDSNLNRGV